MQHLRLAHSYVARAVRELAILTTNPAAVVSWLCAMAREDGGGWLGFSQRRAKKRGKR
jgi:hypothetical protein